VTAKGRHQDFRPNYKDSVRPNDSVPGLFSATKAALPFSKTHEAIFPNRNTASVAETEIDADKFPAHTSRMAKKVAAKPAAASPRLKSSSLLDTRVVYCGDNLEQLAKLPDAYIDHMRPRCVQLARVLKKTGSFYYHYDRHASYYVKVMLDQIFGENNFKKQIYA
jgi:hypothetical protein